MKHTITLFMVTCLNIFTASGQITINATDVPIPGTFAINAFSAGANPNKGPNQTWSYTATPSSSFYNFYNTENDVQWTNQGVDVYYGSFKNLNAGFGYQTWLEIDHNSNGVVEKGINISPQGFDLMSFTGSVLDSLIVPGQNIFYATPKTLMPFPFTNTYTQNYTNARRVVDFILHVPSFGLNYTPCQHIYYEHRKDSVAGWGTMRVYTPNGPSAPYDVLMCKTSAYAIDSFYVSGVPASAALQNAFQIAQGQKTNERNFYNFYRKGAFNYLFRAYYGADNTFTTMEEAFAAADNVAPLAINETPPNNFSTFIYPNPCVQQDIHLSIFGGHAQRLKNYTIISSKGSIICNNKIENQSSELVLPTKSLPTGIYFVSVLDADGKQVIKESFRVQ